MSICTSLDLYLEMNSPISENQVKKSQSRLTSHHPPRRGMGHYTNSWSCSRILNHEKLERKIKKKTT